MPLLDVECSNFDFNVGLFTLVSSPLWLVGLHCQRYGLIIYLVVFLTHFMSIEHLRSLLLLLDVEYSVIALNVGPDMLILGPLWLGVLKYLFLYSVFWCHVRSVTFNSNYLTFFCSPLGRFYWGWPLG